MTLGFSPFGLWPLSLLALAFLVWSFNQSNSSPHPKTRSFIRGGLFGLGFFGSGVSWIYVSLHTYGGANFILAGFITLLFIIYLSLYPALVGFSYQFLFKQPFLLKTLLVFPALWILSEFIRGYLFTGFPWLDIGYSGIHSPYVCMAPIWGVYGVGIVMLFCASLLAI